MENRKFIRINEKYIRIGYIKSFDVYRWYETDSFAIVKINLIGLVNYEEIYIYADDVFEWFHKEECEIKIEPKINKLIVFLENAINGNLDEYFIEI